MKPSVCSKIGDPLSKVQSSLAAARPHWRLGAVAKHKKIVRVIFPGGFSFPSPCSGGGISGNYRLKCMER